MLILIAALYLVVGHYVSSIVVFATDGYPTEGCPEKNNFGLDWNHETMRLLWFLVWPLALIWIVGTILIG